MAGTQSAALSFALGPVKAAGPPLKQVQVSATCSSPGPPLNPGCHASRGPPLSRVACEGDGSFFVLESTAVATEPLIGRHHPVALKVREIVEPLVRRRGL